jgi:hypothetical protein
MWLDIAPAQARLEFPTLEKVVISEMLEENLFPRFRLKLHAYLLLFFF